METGVSLISSSRKQQSHWSRAAQGVLTEELLCPFVKAYPKFVCVHFASHANLSSTMQKKAPCNLDVDHPRSLLTAVHEAVGKLYESSKAGSAKKRFGQGVGALERLLRLPSSSASNTSLIGQMMALPLKESIEKVKEKMQPDASWNEVYTWLFAKKNAVHKFF